MATREPPPPYTRYAEPTNTRDPEVSSIHSAAPSYRSAAPPRPAQAPSSPSPASRPRLLSTNCYAPGFTSRSGNPDIRELQAHNFNISRWSNATSDPKTRHYESVASRRATVAGAESARRNSEMKVVTGPRGASDVEANELSAGLDPAEDPYIVGTEAAERTKKERLVRLRREEGEELLEKEKKSWDFLIAQMADWDERERSWANFQKRLDGRKGLLNRRLGGSRR
ncbi:MAG: hypothetical protein M1814_004726 [Vezdaea aestivalis]|nr:MAG: hypothetical protein M1814_004726 [Vezdaea aestivalis]